MSNVVVGLVWRSVQLALWSWPWEGWATIQGMPVIRLTRRDMVVRLAAMAITVQPFPAMLKDIRTRVMTHYM